MRREKININFLNGSGSGYMEPTQAYAKETVEEFLSREMEEWNAMDYKITLNSKPTTPDQVLSVNDYLVVTPLVANVKSGF